MTRGKPTGLDLSVKSLTLSVEDWDWLKRVAEESGRTASEEVRQLIAFERGIVDEDFIWLRQGSAAHGSRAAFLGKLISACRVLQQTDQRAFIKLMKNAEMVIPHAG